MCAQLPPPPSDERKKVVEDVDRDRRYSIDAAIVRTMKSRKVLQHTQASIPLPFWSLLLWHAAVLDMACSATWAPLAGVLFTRRGHC